MNPPAKLRLWLMAIWLAACSQTPATQPATLPPDSALGRPDPSYSLAFIAFASDTYPGTSLLKSVVRVLTIPPTLTPTTFLSQTFTLPEQYRPITLRWSPTGQQLAVAGHLQADAAINAIFIIDVLTGKLEQLTEQGSYHLCAWSAVAPNHLLVWTYEGTYILDIPSQSLQAVASEEFLCDFGAYGSWSVLLNTTTYELYWLSDNGQEITRLMDNLNVNARGSDLSPNQQKLAVYYCAVSAESCGPHLGIFDMEAKTWLTITSPSAGYQFAGGATWLPDSQTLFFSARVTGTQNSAVYQIDATGQHLQLLVPNAYQPSVAPNGAWVAFTGQSIGDNPTPLGLFERATRQTVIFEAESMWPYQAPLWAPQK